MSEVTPIHRPAATTIEPQARPSRTQTHSQATTRGEDQVVLSDTAQLLSKLRELPDVRQDLVDQVRAAIADGSYETEDKVDAAIENLLEDLS
ncbi:MAG: hypothetical protein Kow00105_07510 [Phycisphaeraceae bacterium]